MEHSHSELIRLMEEAERAYQRVRVLVIDQLPPGRPADEATLRLDQRLAIVDLRAAEQAVQNFRETAYRPRELSGAGAR